VKHLDQLGRRLRISSETDISPRPVVKVQTVVHIALNRAKWHEHGATKLALTAVFPVAFVAAAAAAVAAFVAVAFAVTTDFANRTVALAVVGACACR